jgi:hypothetical protein
MQVARKTTAQPIQNSDCRDRPPQREQRDEREVGREHVRGALHRGGHPLQQPALEAAAGHAGVLDGEEAEQEAVDEQGLREGRLRPAVHRARHDEVADEADGVHEHRAEERVAEGAVQEDQDSFRGLTHEFLL